MAPFAEGEDPEEGANVRGVNYEFTFRTVLFNLPIYFLKRDRAGRLSDMKLWSSRPIINLEV